MMICNKIRRLMPNANEMHPSDKLDQQQIILRLIVYLRNFICEK